MLYSCLLVVNMINVDKGILIPNEHKDYALPFSLTIYPDIFVLIFSELKEIHNLVSC